jgi:hypothetical protein
MPRRFTSQGKSPQYPLDRRLGGPQSRSGRSGEEKNSQPRWESKPRNPIFQPVVSAIPTELSQLLDLGWAEKLLLALWKVKLSLFLTKHHAMKTYWGSESIVPRITHN